MDKVADFGLPLGQYSMEFSDVFKGLFADETDMIDKLRIMEIEIVISTCDYYENKTTYSLRDTDNEYVYTLAGNTLNTTNNPIVFWGLDAYGMNDETKPKN